MPSSRPIWFNIMRVEQAVAELCGDDDFRAKVEYLSQSIGGWERWFQLELAYHIYSLYNNICEIKLEDRTAYSGGMYRADLTLIDKNSMKATTTVELKCQGANCAPSTFASQVDQDIKKGDSAAQGRDYEVIAIVQSEAALRSVKNYLGPRYPDLVSAHKFEGYTYLGGFIHYLRPGNSL